MSNQASAQKNPNDSSDACFAHPADPLANDSVSDNYQRTYPLNNSLNRQGQFASKRHGPRSRTHEVEMPLSQTNIYVRGLPPDFSNDDLKDLCSKFGQIVSTKAVVEPDSSKCRGYGFVDFQSPQAASQALSTINSEGIYEAEMAKEIRGRSSDRHLEQDPTNLYIANLPRDFTESSIREMLAPHGMVISTRVLRNPDGSSRCVGFARMETKQCCDQIISCYNGKKLEENGDPLVVKLADSGARRPKHSTSSSGQSSSDQINVYSNWPSVQTGRYTYSTPGYNDQFSFSPTLTGFQVYDPYNQNLANVPMAVPYPMYQQSPTRQMPSNVQPQAPTTPNQQQMMYQQQVPMQQPTNEYYSKNVYKPQNYNVNAPAYYPTFVPYASEYVVGQQYVQSPASYTNASMVSGQEYIYANGTGNPIYVAGQFYPGLSQMPVQMPDGGSKSDGFGGTFTNEQDEVAGEGLRRPASVEKYDTMGTSSGQQFAQSNIRSYSDTKLNDS